MDKFGFPPTEHALADPPGLLAIGGDLSTERLIHAYSKGIFPWYSEGEPILWWTPEPRCVLFPNDFVLSKSLKKRSRKNYRLSLNTAFGKVIEYCATVDKRRGHTWILPELIQAYSALHTLGYAHSLEVWLDEELIGGLYGIKLGRVFFGESMFSRSTDGSKLALAALSRVCRNSGVTLIDCQVENPHLLSLGACLLSRLDFENILRDNVHATIDQNAWRVPGQTKDLV